MPIIEKNELQEELSQFLILIEEDAIRLYIKSMVMVYNLELICNKFPTQILAYYNKKIRDRNNQFNTPSQDGE